MIAIPSPSFEEDAVCSHICSWLRARKIEHQRIGNNIIAENITNADKPTLMLCAHIDTVSPSPEYSFDPYKPENCPEDMVQGLGSNDDGASVVSMIGAYRHFCSHCAAGRNLILVLTCEEERSGTGGMTGLWPELARKVDFAIRRTDRNEGGDLGKRIAGDRCNSPRSQRTRGQKRRVQCAIQGIGRCRKAAKA